MSKCICAKCGHIFDEEDIKWIEESRGEFWGMPAYERMAYSPCCEDDFYDYEGSDYEEEEELGRVVFEDEKWQVWDEYSLPLYVAANKEDAINWANNNTKVVEILD